jgi:hypothetical protein
MRSSIARIRLALVLLPLLCGAAVGPVHPAVSLTTAVEEVVAAAWTQTEAAFKEIDSALAPAELD